MVCIALGKLNSIVYVSLELESKEVNILTKSCCKTTLALLTKKLFEVFQFYEITKLYTITVTEHISEVGVQQTQQKTKN